MAPRKGFSPFARVIGDELPSLEKYWYVLTASVCGNSPSQFYKKSGVVQSFPEEFKMVQRETLRLADETVFDAKAYGNCEVVASSFGLLVVLLRQQSLKNLFASDSSFGRLREFLNGLDFCCLADETAGEAVTRDAAVSAVAPVPKSTPSGNEPPRPRPRAARKLTLPPPLPSKTVQNTPPPCSSRISKQQNRPSPNMKEISENTEIDTPEKKLLITKRGQQLIGQLQAVCEEKRESLSTVLSYLCAFGDQDATAVIQDVIEDVTCRKGVKRGIQDLAGEETYAKYVESLRVPDWILLFFKTRARISGQTWQAVLNITQLGRTGVSF